MITEIKLKIEKIGKVFFSETKLSVYDIQAAQESADGFSFSGKLLDQNALSIFSAEMVRAFPQAEFDFSKIALLRHGEYRRVRMNLTSMHAEMSFTSELTTQQLYGDQIEVLEDYDKWILGRNAYDGYIGLTYAHYLGVDVLPAPTHIVTFPVCPVLDKAENGNAIGRILGGTFTSILDARGDMRKIRFQQDGWIPAAYLRDIVSFPKEAEALRAMVCENALSLYGVPYLWGGSSANGIDCSGLAQWCYRLAGIPILRDAHMQMVENLMVEPPFLPGDLVFYGERKDDGVSVTHVSISLGGWEVIHSSRSRNGVYIDDVMKTEHLKHSYIGAARVIS